MNYTNQKVISFEDFPEDVRKDIKVIITGNYVYTIDSVSTERFTINLDYLNNFDGWYNVAKSNVSSFLLGEGFELGEVIYIDGIY